MALRLTAKPLPLHLFRNKHGKKRRRPHVLKIDVEGHDYLVLMGFLLDATPVTELPLLIEFEVYESNRC